MLTQTQNNFIDILNIIDNDYTEEVKKYSPNTIKPLLSIENFLSNPCSHCASSKKQFAALTNVYAQTNQEHNFLKRKIIELENTVLTLENDCQKLHKIIIQETSNEQKNKKNIFNETLIMQIYQENNLLKTQIEQSTQQLNEQRHKIEEYNNLKKHNSEYCNDLLILQARFDALRATQNITKKNIIENEKNKKILQDTIILFQNQIIYLEKEIEDFKNKKEENKNNIQKQQKKKQKNNKTFVVEEYIEKNTMLIQKIKEYEENIAKQHNETNQLISFQHKIQQENSDLISQNNALKIQNADKNNKYNQLNKQNKEWVKINIQLTKDLEQRKDTFSIQQILIHQYQEQKPLYNLPILNKLFEKNKKVT